MNTLWIFGDSYSEVFKDGIWAREYLKTLNHIPKNYAEIISEKLQFKLNNHALGGSDNYQIFETFCKNAHLIKETDLVIFGWSSTLRFRLITKDNEWLPLIPYHVNCIERYEDISEQTVNEILVNRMSEKYLEELNNWIRLINLQKFKSIHWTPFTYPSEFECLPVKIYGPTTIKTETKGKVDDGHFSEKGHQELSDTLYNEYRKLIKKSLWTI